MNVGEVEILKRVETVELTNLCLIRRGNDILLQNRVKADWRGLALPGGHVEPGGILVAQNGRANGI